MTKREFLEHTARDPMTVLIKKFMSGEALMKDMRKMMSKSEAFDDLAYFRYVMEEGYSGYTYYEKSQWDRAFAEMHEKLAACGDEIATTDMLEIIHDALHFICDGHLSFIIGEKNFRFFKKEAVYTADIMLREYAGGYICTDSGKKVTFDDGITLFPTLPDENGPLFLVGKRSREAVENITVKLDGEDTELPVHRIRSEPGKRSNEQLISERYYDDIAVISHKTCVGDPDKYLESFRRAGERCRTCNHVIFDLVNNGGGNSVFPETFFKALYGWKYDKSVVKVNRSSLITAKMKGEIEEGVPVHFEEGEKDAATEQESIFKGRLHVVINDGIASSGELAIVMASAYDNVTFYGSNSAGIGKYGDLFIYDLPRSGAILMVPHKIFDNGIEETVGYNPDIWLDTEDPVGAVLEYVKNHK